MKSEIIIQAQKYLTISDGFSNRKIADIEMLLKNHNPAEIILFLKNLYREKKEKMLDLLESDTTTREFEQTIGCLFRIHIALKIITDQLEEETYESQQRTGTGG